LIIINDTPFNHNHIKIMIRWKLSWRC